MPTVTYRLTETDRPHMQHVPLEELDAWLARRQDNGHLVDRIEVPLDEKVAVVLKDVDGATGQDVLEKAELARTDLRMARVVEDVVDVLEAKGVMARSDLPQEAQDRIARRETMRASQP